MNDLINLNAKTPAEMAKKIVKLKDLKSQIICHLDDKIKEISNSLLESMKEFDVLTLKTEDLTITRQTRITVKVDDVEDVEDFFKNNNYPFSTTLVPDEPTMKSIKDLAKKNIEGDGIEMNKTEFVANRATKKGKYYANTIK